MNNLNRNFIQQSKQFDVLIVKQQYLWYPKCIPALDVDDFDEIIDQFQEEMNEDIFVILARFG
jgi:hypothetical protein